MELNDEVPGRSAQDGKRRLWYNIDRCSSVTPVMKKGFEGTVQVMCADDLPENAEALVGREFVHFKGGHYRLRAFATNTETCETMVVYEALYGDGGLWVRPAKMFFETVTRDGRSFPRFKSL